LGFAHSCVVFGTLSFNRSLGGIGTQLGEFVNPQDVAVSPSLVVVADTGNDRIQLFNHNGVNVG